MCKTEKWFFAAECLRNTWLYDLPAGASAGLLAIPRKCQAETLLALAVPLAGMHFLPIRTPFSPCFLQTSLSRCHLIRSAFPDDLNIPALSLSPYFAYLSSCKFLIPCVHLLVYVLLEVKSARTGLVYPATAVLFI